MVPKIDSKDETWYLGIKRLHRWLNLPRLRNPKYVFGVLSSLDQELVISHCVLFSRSLISLHSQDQSIKTRVFVQNGLRQS